MSLKAELETWAAALKAYDEEDFEKSLDLFSVRPSPLFSLPASHPFYSSQAIADSSKILTNMGLIYATLGEHEAAVEQFIAATRLDNYLAVALVTFPSPPRCRFFFFFSHLQIPVTSSVASRISYLVVMICPPKSLMMPYHIYGATSPCMCSPGNLPHVVANLHVLSSNYTQLGLAFTLYSAEVLFNRGKSLSLSLI